MATDPGDRGFPWPDGKLAAVSWSFDVDAETPLLYADPEWKSRFAPMSAQAFGPLVGVPRFLDILARHSQSATFFIPGYVADTYPDMVRMVVGAGHEVGHHGYLHEPMLNLSSVEEQGVLDRGLESLAPLTEAPPVGFRAPSGEMSFQTPRLLTDRGFRYDSSLMDADTPYVMGIDETRSLVELPYSWASDDWEQYAFIPGFDDGRPIESPSKVHEMWWADIEAHIRYGGHFNLVNHPFLSGRAARAAAMEQMLERLLADERIWFTTLGEIAAYVDSLSLRPKYHVDNWSSGER